MTTRTLHTVLPENPPRGGARPPRPGRLKRPAPLAGKAANESSKLCAIAARLAASHYDISLADIGARTRRSRRAARARHVAMYLAHVGFGLSLAAIGIAFGRSRRSTAHACARIEDARDDPAFDAALAGLEISARVLLDVERERKAA